MNSLLFKIVYDSVTTELTHSPDGWDDGLLNLTRQKVSSALFRSYTIKLGFVKEGADLLRNIFYTDKIDATANLEIWKLNGISLEYELKYTGEFDFQSFKDEDVKITITVLDTSILNFIKAYGGTKHEVEIGAFTYSKAFWYVDPVDSIEKYVLTYTLGKVFELLLDKVTGGLVTSGTYAVDVSTLNEFDYLVGTGGEFRSTDLIYMIKTSLNEYLDTIFILTGLVMDIVYVDNIETIRFVALSDVYDGSGTPYHLTNISNFSLEPDKEKLFSSLKIGYEEQDYSGEDDTLNGNKEVNGLTTFKSQIKRSKNDLDMSIKYRADWTGVLNILADLNDTSADNDIFIFAAYEPNPVENPGYYIAAPGTLMYETIEYVLVNSKITPKRLLLNHVDYLSSLLDNEGGSIIYTSSSYRNSANQTHPISVAYTEEFTGITLTAPVHFKPYIFEFDSFVDDDFYDSMVSDSSQLLSFEYRGFTFTCFLIDTKIKLHGKSQVHIKAISSAENDLTNLST